MSKGGCVDHKGREILNNQVTGIVKWFNVKRGYGYIHRDDNDTDIFVHGSDILKYHIDKGKTLGEDEDVVFDVIKGEKGLQASNITGPNGDVVKGSNIIHRSRQSSLNDNMNNLNLSDSSSRGRGEYRPRRSRGRGNGRNRSEFNKPSRDNLDFNENASGGCGCTGTNTNISPERNSGRGSRSSSQDDHNVNLYNPENLRSRGRRNGGNRGFRRGRGRIF